MKTEFKTLEETQGSRKAQDATFHPETSTIIHELQSSLTVC